MALDTPVLRHKRDFLVVYDYGMGGVWAMVAAHSPEEIKASFPKLRVFEVRPEWMSDEQFEIAASQKVDVETNTPPQWLIEASKPAS